MHTIHAHYIYGLEVAEDISGHRTNEYIGIIFTSNLIEFKFDNAATVSHQHQMEIYCLSALLLPLQFLLFWFRRKYMQYNVILVHRIDYYCSRRKWATWSV